MNSRPPLYLFNWPSNVGGADTKVTHLLLLLHRDFDITVVPNRREQLGQLRWRKFLKNLGVKAALLGELPRKLRGTALSLCNGEFFAGGIAGEAKARGLRIVWSSEMMWHHPGEIAAAASGLIDKVLYVSEVQRAALARWYGNLPSAVTGNYIDPQFFPFKERWRAPRRFEEFVVGRLSRPDPAKFPEDFPESYQRLFARVGRVAPRAPGDRKKISSLCHQESGARGATRPTVRFRVMAWSEELTRLFAAERFRGRWELLHKEAESQVEFLHSLDLFVYDLGPRFCESWGRAVVEAMLTGCVPLVSGEPRHHLRELVPHGVAGFLCTTPEEWRECAQRLREDGKLFRQMSRAARAFAENELCRAGNHREVWQHALAE